MARPRLCYTKEELLALRETLAVETLPNPVPPDCPIYMDSDVLLQETTVTKRQKSGRTVQMRKEATTPAFLSFMGGSRAANPVLPHEDALPRGASNQQPNRAEEYGDVDERWRTVMMPPRLQVPIVTIGRHRGRGASEAGEGRTKTVVDVDSERQLLARLRLQQPKRRRHAEHEGVRGEANCNGVLSGGVELVTPLELGLKAASHHAPLDATTPTDINTGTSPLLDTDTAVPITNVSLFNSVLGSRYFQFTRSLGLWEYLFSTLGTRCSHPLGSAARAEDGGGEFNNSNGSASGYQSSIGFDDSGTIPAELEKGDGDPLGTCTSSSSTTVKGRRPPHRRRTNRTHAEKREYRRARELLEQNCDDSVMCAMGDSTQDGSTVGAVCSGKTSTRVVVEKKLV